MTSIDRLPWKTPGQSSSAYQNERLIKSFSTHWIKYVSPALGFLLLLGICVLIFSLSISLSSVSWGLFSLFFLIGTVLCLAAHHWFFYRILSEGMVDIIITNKRFMYLEERLLLQDDMHETALKNILAVEAKKHGLLKNILSYGDLWFDTGGARSDKSHTVYLVPNPMDTANLITSLIKNL